MYAVKTKKVGNKNYKKLKEFKTYDKAYSYLGDMLQVKHNLHWSYSAKYLMCGYDRKKLLTYGTSFLRRRNICYKIVEL